MPYHSTPTRGIEIYAAPDGAYWMDKLRRLAKRSIPFYAILLMMLAGCAQTLPAAIQC
jgi:hypothetical protein